MVRVSFGNPVICVAAVAIVLSETAFANRSWHLIPTVAGLAVIAGDWFLIARRRKDMLGLAWGTYIVIVGAGLVVASSKHPPKLLLALIGVVSAVAFCAGLYVLFKRVTAMQEVEQKIIHHATVVAFGVTLLVLSSTGLITGFLEVAYPTPWVFFVVALGAWIFAVLHSRRKYT